MNITLIKLKGVIHELQLLRTSIDRLGDLYELDLQHVKGITTRVVTTPKSELEDGQVAYTNPAVTEMIAHMEAQAGRTLEEDEINQVIEAIAAETICR